LKWISKLAARGANNADLGKVQEVNEDFIITERGTITKEKFHLPRSIPQEEEAKAKFIIDTTTSSSSSPSARSKV